MRTLYKIQKPGRQKPQLCDIYDIEGGDTVFIDNAPMIVTDPPRGLPLKRHRGWQFTLTDAAGKDWTKPIGTWTSEMEHQTILTFLKDVENRLAAAIDAGEPAYLTDGTVTRRIIRVLIDEGAEKGLPAPLCDKDSLGVLLDTGNWVWLEEDENGALPDIGLVTLSSELYLAPLWWIKL